jgi:hypothetical protein
MGSLIILTALFANTTLLSNAMAQENGYEDDSYNTYSSDLYTSWEDFTPGNTDIFFKSSHALHEPLNLSNTTGTSQSSQVSSSDDNVYVIWEDNISGNNDILMRGNGGGVTFGSTINISNNIGSSQFPHISSIGKDIYVVLQDFTAGAGEIFSITNNQIISSPINLSNNSGNSQSPQISSS